MLNVCTCTHTHTHDVYNTCVATCIYFIYICVCDMYVCTADAVTLGILAILCSYTTSATLSSGVFFFFLLEILCASLVLASIFLFCTDSLCFIVFQPMCRDMCIFYCCVAWRTARFTILFSI